jgi:DNA-binding SARP family transcriptional activator
VNRQRSKEAETPAGDAVEIRLIGELAVVRGGRAQALPASKKTRALLAYLVATGRPHLRESLCALLWDGPDDPRAELRWSLTKIRPLLDAGGGRLEADRERAAFVPGPVQVDTTAVRELVGGGVASAGTDALRRAAALCRGELLEGLDLPGCFRYHEWCVGEREALRALRGAVLTELAARLGVGAAAELEEALRWARQRVAFDPLTEAAHVDVVRILGRLGRVREGLAQVETCRRILETELGARVSEALEQARRELTARPAAAAEEALRPTHAPAPQRNAAPAATGPTSSPVEDRPPLVGRDAMRSTVESLVAAARSASGPAGLLLVGDPGIGKTRLLDLVAEEVQSAGGTVLRGRAFEAEMVRPYGPWIDAFASARLPPGAPLGPELGPVLPGLAPAADASAPAGELPGADRGRLYDAAARLLAHLAARSGPLGVILDDVQWLDEASAALLHFVARGAVGGRILVACAARAGELGDNAAALRVVRALDRERWLVQHRLEPLGPAETAALVRAVSPDLDAAQTFASSEGNPLYALEIARAAAAGTGHRDESLEHLLDDRLERLADGGRELAPWAAALGRSFDPEVLALVRGTTPAELLDALEDLERHAVIRAASTTHYDFAHDLLRQAAYRRLSQPRRRLVHLQIARALEAARGGDDALASEIAHHAGVGGDDLLAARASLAAGRRCLRLYAQAEAAELAARGLQQVGRLDRQSRARLQIGLYAVLVDSGHANRNVATVEAGLSRAIVEAQEAGLHAEAADGFRVRSLLHYADQNFAAARESSIRAVDELGAVDPAARGRALADSARCLMLLESDVARARDLIGEARALFGAEADRVTNVAWATGILARYLGDTAAAAPALEIAVEGFAREDAHWERCQALAQRVMLDLEAGAPASAADRCRSLAEVAEKMPEGSEPAVAAALAALADRATDRDEATARLDRALGDLVTADAKAMIAYVQNAAAAQDLAAADPTGAEDRAGRALAAATVVGRRSEIAVARALLGRAALARGDRAGAAEHLQAVRSDRATALGLSARAAEVVDTLNAALESDAVSRSTRTEGLRSPRRPSLK